MTWMEARILAMMAGASGIARLLPGVAPAEPLALAPWTAQAITRKIVSMGPGTDEIKVMFDNPQAGTGKQQCWHPCLSHCDQACIRWRTVVPADVKLTLASLYAWHVAGKTQFTVRATHMAYEPTQAEVERCHRSLVLQDY